MSMISKSERSSFLHHGGENLRVPLTHSNRGNYAAESDYRNIESDGVKYVIDGNYGEFNSDFGIPNNFMPNYGFMLSSLNLNVERIEESGSQHGMLPKIFMDTGINTPYISFFTLLILNAVDNLDHGIIPAMIGSFSNENISYLNQAWLGSVVYLGLIAGTLFAPLLLKILPTGSVLLFNNLLLAVTTIAFPLIDSFAVRCAIRFVVGWAQSIMLVYLPVWINVNAPSSSLGIWNASAQLTTFLGTLFGYLLGGFAPILVSNPDNIEKVIPYPFYIQASLTSFAILFFLFVGSKNVRIVENDVHEKCKTEEDNRKPASSLLKIAFQTVTDHMHNMFAIISNRECILLILAISNVYFILSGIQFWIIEYMESQFKVTRVSVTLITTALFLSGPTTGVLLGGRILDKYKAPSVSKLRVLNLILAIAIISSILSFLIPSANTITSFTVLLWITLFLGSSLVPMINTTLMEKSASNQRYSVSAVMQLAVNLFGWLPGPLASGIIMEFAKKTNLWDSNPVKLGFTIMLKSNILGLICIALAWLLEYRKELGKLERNVYK